LRFNGAELELIDRSRFSRVVDNNERRYRVPIGMGFAGLDRGGRRAMIAKTLRSVSALALALLMASVAESRAQSDVARFYSGNTVRLISGAGSGSGYTIWTRFIAQYLGRFIPGNPTVIVQIMAGAGGLIATNYGYNSAPNDGTVIVSVARESAIISVLKAKGVEFDATKFQWLGSPVADTNICIASKNAPWKTLSDYYSKQLLVGTDGIGSGMHYFPVALDTILGMKFKVIDGYADSSVVLLAIDDGEIHGACQSAETLMQDRGSAIASGALKVVLQMGLKPDPKFPGVPFVLGLAKTPDQRQALTFLFASGTFGRPFVVPPGTPPARVAALRKAFSDMFKDPQFLRDAKRLGYDINPMSGEDMQALVNQVAQTPKPIVNEVDALIEPPGTR
jgi:tripartite-type tricarboxylate transporter receptor subunit TctC